MSIADVAQAPGTTTASQSARAGRVTALEGMRGAVMLMTMIYHAWQFGGGPAGHQEGAMAVVARGGSWVVSFFFVMTGMLVYGSFCRKVLDGADPGSAGRTLLRRLLRVLPLYWVALLVVWAARNPGFPGDLVDLGTHVTLTQVFDQERIFFSIGPAWSLAPQIALYLALALAWRPLTSAAARRARRGRTAVLLVPPAVLVLGGVGYLAFVTVVAPAAGDDWPVWFNPLALAPSLGVGMAIAVLDAVRPLSLERRAARVAGSAAALLAIAGMVLLAQQAHPDTLSVQVFRLACTGAFGVFVLVCLGLPPGSAWSRLWSARPLVWLGTISFSVYLWHEPALLFMRHLGVVSTQDPTVWTAGVQIVAGTLVGWLAYCLLERPMGMVTDAVGERGGLTSRYEVASRRRAPQRGKGSLDGVGGGW